MWGAGVVEQNPNYKQLRIWFSLNGTNEEFICLNPWILDRKWFNLSINILQDFKLGIYVYFFGFCWNLMLKLC